VAHVLANRLRVALERRAHAGAAGAELDQHVAGLDLLQTVGRDADQLLGALQERATGRRRPAAEHALAKHLVAVGAAGRHAPGGALVDGAPAAPAAPAPGAGAHKVRPDLELLDPPREADLLLLDVAADDGR